MIWIGQLVLHSIPGLRTVVAFGAAGWVAILAFRLWQVPEGAVRSQSVGARALFVTTALNPKALIFGLVLLPSPERLAENLLLFASLVVVVAILWAGIGAVLRYGTFDPSRNLFLLRRLASVFLAVMSVLLVLHGIAT